MPCKIQTIACLGGSRGACDAVAYTRGLCASCYTQTMRDIKIGKAVAEELIAAGKFLAARKSAFNRWRK